jgi:hypothetical protein
VKRRPRRSIPAVLTALVLLSACVFTAIVAFQNITDQPPWVSYTSVANWLHGQHWNGLLPMIAAGTSVLLGFVLLLAAVLPGKLTVLPLQGQLESGASRRSYRSTLRAAASGVDGVSATKLKLGRRRVTARVRTERITTDGLREAVQAAIADRLAQIAPATSPTVNVRVKATRSPS